MWSGADIAKALEIPATSIYRAVRSGSLVPDARSERIFLFRTASLKRVLYSLAGHLSAFEFARRIASFDLEPTAIDADTVRLEKVSSSPMRELNVSAGPNPGEVEAN